MSVGHFVVWPEYINTDKQYRMQFWERSYSVNMVCKSVGHFVVWPEYIKTDKQYSKG